MSELGKFLFAAVLIACALIGVAVVYNVRPVLDLLGL